MPQPLGHSLNDMWSSAPLLGAGAGRREEHMQLEFRRKFLDLCAPASSVQGDHNAVYSQHLARPSSLCHCRPPSLLPRLPVPASLAVTAVAHRNQTEGGRRAKREEATLGSQRALSVLGRGQGVDLWPSFCMGDRIYFLYCCIRPMRPTHGNLLSLGSQWK